MQKHGWLVGAMLVASVAGGALSNLFLTVGLGAQGAEVVSASQVNIVDRGGRLRAVLSGEDERGQTSLAFYGPGGVVRTVVGTEPDGAPLVWLNDGEGRTRVSVGVRGTNAVLTVGDGGSPNVMIGSLGGTPVVGLSDGAQTRLQMDLGPEGQPSLNLQGQPALNLFGAPGRRAVGVSVDAAGAPLLSLYDASGAPRVAMGAFQGTTVINLGDGTRPRLVLGVTEEGEGSVGFYDAEGALVRLEDAASSR